MPLARQDHISIYLNVDGRRARPPRGRTRVRPGEKPAARHVPQSTRVVVKLPEGGEEQWTAGGESYVAKQLGKAREDGRIDQGEEERLLAFNDLYNFHHGARDVDGGPMVGPDPFYATFTEDGWYDHRPPARIYRTMKTRLNQVTRGL